MLEMLSLLNCTAFLAIILSASSPLITGVALRAKPHPKVENKAKRSPAFAQKGAIRFELDSRNTTRAIAFSPSGDFFVSAGNASDQKDKYVVLVWDIKEKKLRASIPTDFETFIARVDISPDSKRILAADSHGNVGVFDLKGKKLQSFRQFEKARNWILDIKFVDDGSVLTIGHESVASKRNLVARSTGIYHLNESYSYCAAISKESCVWVNRRFVYVWTPMLNEQVDVVEIDAKDNKFWRAVISEDGSKVLCVTQDSSFHLYDVASRKLIKTWEGHDGSGLSALITLPRNIGFASADEDGLIKVWSATGTLIAQMARGEESVMCLAVDRGLQFLASAGFGRQIVMWDLKQLLKGKPLE